MEKNIKDFIHFYLGCECVNSSFPKGHLEYDKGWKFRGIDLTTPKSFLIETETEYTFSESIMLKLRKLESMTEEEWQEIRFHLSPDIVASVPLVKWSDRPRWVIVLENRVQTNTLKFLDGIELIKRGYDVFKLIDSGLAIEKQPTTLNQGV